MKVVVTADARAIRGAVGLTAWAVLEELLLDAHVDDHGALVARTNVRRLASQLSVSKDTAARAISRLVHAGVVERVVAERGPRGALPASRNGSRCTRRQRPSLSVRPSRELLVTTHVSLDEKTFDAVTHWHPAVPGHPVAVPATLPTAVRSR